MGENLAQNAKEKLKAYLSSLDDYDTDSREDALKSYLKEIEKLFDANGITAIDIDELKAKIKDGLKFDYAEDLKVYDRKLIRQMEYEDEDYSIRTQKSYLDESPDIEEQYVEKKSTTDTQEIIEEEGKESIENMRKYLNEVLSKAQIITAKEMLSKGYYDINDLLLEMKQISGRVSDNISFDYEENIKKTRDKAIESLEDTLNNSPKNDINTPQVDNSFDAKSIYKEYLLKGPKMELNLGQEDLGIKICVVNPPSEDINGNLEKKGLIISKSILEQAVNENNPNITRDDENYVKVEEKHFYILVKEEEHEKAMGITPKQKENQREKKAIKNEKEQDEYMSFL